MLRVVVLAVLCATLTARAQPATSEADRLFEEGRALAKKGNHERACPLFAKSLALDHSIGTQLNLADCHEQLGRLREAWLLFTSAANESARSADVKRTAFARQRAATLATKLTTVVIRVTRPVVGLSITVAGNPVEPGSEIVDLEQPGPIEVVATLAGSTPFTTTVTGTAGETVHVTVPAFEARIERPLIVEKERRRSRVRLAWGLVAGSGVTAITGTIFALKGRSDYHATADGSHCMSVVGGIICDPVGTQEIQSAQRLSNIGTVFAIATGALVAGAAISYLTAPYEAITVAPLASETAAGLVLQGAF